MTNEDAKYYRVVDSAGDPDHKFDQYLLPIEVYKDVAKEYSLSFPNKFNLRSNLSSIDFTKPGSHRLVQDKPTHVFGLAGHNYEEAEVYYESIGLGKAVVIDIPKELRISENAQITSMSEFVRNLALLLSERISE